MVDDLLELLLDKNVTMIMMVINNFYIDIQGPIKYLLNLYKQVIFNYVTKYINGRTAATQQQRWRLGKVVACWQNQTFLCTPSGL